MNSRTCQPLYILTHHKCASTWLVAYLQSLCLLNSLNLFHSHCSHVLPRGAYDIAVLTNASYCFCRKNIAHGIHVIRNPLDILVSAYYSHLNTHSLEKWAELAIQRDCLRASSKNDGFFLTLAFLERVDFHPQTARPFCALRHWHFGDEHFITLRMEDIVCQPNDVFGSRLLSHFVGAQLPEGSHHTFEAITQRKPGEIDEASHYRAGRANEWRTELPVSVVRYIRNNFDVLLSQFYESALI